MTIRSVYEIGNLWPKCKTCGHIAQSHNEPGPNSPNEHSCDETYYGKCPTCGTHGKQFTCQCNGYIGMTKEEWYALLTPEEIAYYHYDIE